MDRVEKMFLQWDEIENDCKDLYSKLLQEDKYDCIVSVGRGGMIPARLLSEYLDVPKVYIFDIKTYTGINQYSGFEIGSFNYMELNNKNILLIDDVYCTGRTLKKVKELFTQKIDNYCLTTCTLYCDYNGKNDGVVDLYSKEYDREKTWIVYPWEICN